MEEGMTEDDVLYFQRRAGAELELAQRATKPEVVAAHHRLAEAYLDRIASVEPARQVEHA
ncbi:hypothetical protein D9602_21405 [Sphingomonas sp. TX0522]|uniref:Uncharacterized protein n=2 Tax=Sphingomonadaceae TaxID=41297 RepID=A0A369VQ95_9SPHN|nr:hypothetical protein [Sphingomonas sp. TX0522]RDE04183.1 hypothetical protein DVW87_17350 [Sphingomonas aracearum]